MNKFDKFFKDCKNSRAVLSVLWKLLDMYPESDREEIFNASSRANARMTEIELILAEQGIMAEY